MEICGIGSILFMAKSGEHKMLHGVYISVLRISILSLGQLDEGISWVEIDRGILQIWDRHKRLLTKVSRGLNRLYVLHLEVARPLCLATRRDDEAWCWHEWFEHLHFEALQKQQCDICVVTK